MAEKARLFLVLALTLVWINGVESQRCGSSLGASSRGYLRPSSFNASSFRKWFEPQKGRIGNALTAWMPENYKPEGKVRSDFLQVDLGALKAITGVKVQGYPTNDFYVQTLFILFSKDGRLFHRYLEQGEPKRFVGNINSTLIKTIRWGCEVHARYVRFHPLHFKGGIALNVDVLGCEIIRGVAPSVKDFSIKLSSSPSSVQLNWKQVRSNVHEFHITINGENPRRIPLKTFTMLPVSYSHMLQGLKKCTEYLFGLLVYDKSGCGIPQVHELTYLTRDKVSPPMLFKADTSIPGTVMLTWKKPLPSGECNATSDEVSGYKIMYRESNSPSSSPSQRQLPGDMTSVTLPGLHMWKSYDIQIQAFSSYPMSPSGSNGAVHQYFSGEVLLSDVLVQGKLCFGNTDRPINRVHLLTLLTPHNSSVFNFLFVDH